MQTLIRAARLERLVGVLCVAALLMVASLATAPPSDADICKNFGLSAKCRIVFGGDKSNGGGGGSDGKDGPVRPPCHRGAPEYQGINCESIVGIWSNARQCYVLESQPQPDPEDPIRRGKTKGKQYDCTRVNDEGKTVLGVPFWSEEVPGTDGPADLQEDLETAIGLKFRAMYPGLAPAPIPQNGKFDQGWRMAPVGLWVWMWPRTPQDSQWGPIDVKDPDTGYQVNAAVTHVRWEMGDGTTKTCDKSPPFMPYMRDRTPTCGHKYKKPGNYLVRVTTYWHITYVDAAGYNETKLEFPQSLYVRIGESQVISK